MQRAKSCYTIRVTGGYIQNWEALALSYPDYISGMIAKFVNASSADGYNRIALPAMVSTGKCLNPIIRSRILVIGVIIR